jgi:hypothetical protein
MHIGDTDTLRVHKEAYVLPPRRTELSRSPMSQARAYPLVLMPLFVRLYTLQD